jgi:citrate lyase subunit beta/citryl-CoA lyase
VSAALARSYLYAPGDRADRLAGALTRGPDAVIADLEDAVASDRKVHARSQVRRWLDGQPPTPGPQRWVRINADSAVDDLDAVVRPGLTGLVVPKGDEASVAEIGRLLDGLERDRGLPAGIVRLLPLIEGAVGLLEVNAIARQPRVHRIGLGEVDLAADLGLHLDASRSALTSVRLQVVIASAAAGIARPVGPTSTDFRDLDAFRESAIVLRRLGFRARTAIHPAQLDAIHEVFTPSAEDIAQARDLLERHAAGGGGGGLDAHGRFVDLAVLREAREIIASAR